MKITHSVVNDSNMVRRRTHKCFDILVNATSLKPLAKDDP